MLKICFRRFTMRRLTMFLLSVVLLGASACGAPFPLFATRTPTLTPTITPTFTRTLPPTYTPTPTPPPLESLGLGYFPHSLLIRQGWQITWDAPNSRYIIRQAAWDETYQTFLNRPTHGIGWIDLDGNFHTRLTRFSATENPDGTWTDTSTTQDLVIPQLRPNASTPQPGTWNLPTWNLIETKNPAFEKTGILTLTYLDENGAPQTVTYNRELNFLQMPEISTDLLHPTPIPIEAVHSLAAHQMLILNYGDGEPFPTENFPGWSLQFQYFPESDTSRAYLWPRSGETAKYIRFIGENDFSIPWFMIVLPDGTAYPSAPVEIFNPQDPQNPTDGSQKLILFPVFLGEMNQNQRLRFQEQYLSSPEEFRALFGQRIITLAQADGYFSRANIGRWADFYDPSSLDSLLGMEGNDVRRMEKVPGSVNIARNTEGYLEQLSENNRLIEALIQAGSLPLPFTLQQFVLAISP
jgi:hypothetical protein